MTLDPNAQYSYSVEVETSKKWMCLPFYILFNTFSEGFTLAYSEFLTFSPEN